jgi:ribose transport system ATP-binding protein
MLLEVNNLSKSFGPQVAVDRISFSVDKGDAVAFIGENGAGKSTVAKCLVGVHEPDSGKVSYRGEILRNLTPRTAKQLGIAFLPQELSYVPELSVAENITLGQWPCVRGVTGQRWIRKRASIQLERLELAIPVRARMKDLSVGERQLVEIAKALLGEMELLVLDEPTASLNDDESQRLFSVVTRLTTSGVGVVFISHRMDEVHKFSQRVNVMRNGRLVATLDPRTATSREMVEHMLGRSPEVLASSGSARRYERPVVELRHASLAGSPSVVDANLAIHSGEVLGLFGVRGCGAELLSDAFVGQARLQSGEILKHGEAVDLKSARHALRHGIAFVPSERKRDGLVATFSVAGNITLPLLSRLSVGGIRVPGRETGVARALAATHDVRCKSVRQPIGQLSGGNQQKAMLASRIASAPDVLVLNEPTRGVDVGARLEIHRMLRKLAGDGMACLLVSSDVEEVVTVSDRVLILRDGAIVEELVKENKTVANAVHAAAGGTAAAA